MRLGITNYRALVELRDCSQTTSLWLIFGTASLTYPVDVALGLSIELRYEYEGLRSNDPLQNYNSHNLGLFLHWWPGRGSLQHRDRLAIYEDSIM